MRTTKTPAVFGRLALVGMVAATLSACAMAPKSEDEIVLERAQERWDAVIAGDLETAYTYYSPGFRATTSLIDYGVSMKTRKVRWTSATYKNHECEENRCSVNFDVGFKVGTPVPGLTVYEGSQGVEDRWIRTDGQWWYVPKN